MGDRDRTLVFALIKMRLYLRCDRRTRHQPGGQKDPVTMLRYMPSHESSGLLTSLASISNHKQGIPSLVGALLKPLSANIHLGGQTAKGPHEAQIVDRSHA